MLINEAIKMTRKELEEKCKNSKYLEVIDVPILVDYSPVIGYTIEEINTDYIKGSKKEVVCPTCGALIVSDFNVLKMNGVKYHLECGMSEYNNTK